jgi:5'-nucleotidase / UDP-sugar diphosphatase
MLRKPFMTWTGFALTIGLAACASSFHTHAPLVSPKAPFELTLLHINDHHSHLDAETASLQMQTANGRRTVKVERGGFARIAGLMDELSAGRDDVIKLHAGDATTGDLYYTMTQGRADAALMNTVCFDVMTLGNHEFDSGDAGLAGFLDALRAGPCHTAVISANVRPQIGVSPLAKMTAGDYFTPSTVLLRKGQRIGVIGITVALKTKYASRPDPGTEFLDEIISAQTEINRLRASGIDKIILLTHQGYDKDIDMAPKLSGVDVIVGGDSHTLLGDATLSLHGMQPAGPYPTMVTNRDGNRVCIVQAWQYSQALGELRVDFDAQGDVTRCSGTVYLPIGDTFTAASGPALNFEDQAAIRADLAGQKSLRITTPSAKAMAVLKPFREARAALAGKVVGEAAEVLCLRRLPGNLIDTTSSTQGRQCQDSERGRLHGGDIQQLVAQAYLEQGQAYGGADLALLNAGGVRIDLPAGGITMGQVFALLPFHNTLVRLTMSGQELDNALEDALDNMLVNRSTGAYPYAAGLRWHVDVNQAKGQRFSQLEVRQADGRYRALDPIATYRVIASDFMADGGDHFDTLKTITGPRRENTYLDYAEPFIDYLKRHPHLQALPEAQYSTQVFIGPK